MPPSRWRWWRNWTGWATPFLTFALTVLPALLALGLTSYSRLADLAVHDAYYARAIGRIRAFYLTIEPSAQQYWLVPAGDDAHAVMRQSGQPHSRWHHLGHTATAVAAVVGVITGAFLGVLGSVVTPLTTSVLAAGATVAAVAAFAVLLADQERRWRRSDDSLQSQFPPDGTPSMSVTMLGDRTSPNDPMGRLSALLSSTARFGLMRLVVGLSGETLPPTSEAAERASLATSEHLRSTIDEYRQGGTSAKEAAALTSFDDKPLFVLTASRRSSWCPRSPRISVTCSSMPSIV